MQRLDWPEFSDQAWLPKAMRRCITSYLDTLHGFLRTPQLWAPLVARTMGQQQSIHLIDLCSGSGGPATRLRRELQDRHQLTVNLTLTDLYPDAIAVAGTVVAKDPGLHFYPRSIDAGAIPAELLGGRLLICGFHHLPAIAAKRLIADAAAARAPLMIFEITDRSALSLLTTVFITPFLVLILTPRIRRLSLLQVLLTYVLPFLPFMIAWDNLASCLRTYSLQDLQALTSEHSMPRYRWEIGAVGPAWQPMRWPYLLGRAE